MKPEIKKNILISLWILLAVVFVSAAGWYIYYLSQYKTYQDSQLKFSIKYPSQWQMKDHYLGTAVTFIRPRQSALEVFQPNVNMTVQEVPDQIATLESYSEVALKQMKAVFQKKINILEDKDFEFGKRKGHRLMIEAPEPQNLKAIFIWTIKGSNAYIFTFVSRIDQYAEVSKNVNEMISSFTFL